MTCNPDAFVSPSRSTPSFDETLMCSVQTGFLAHKYLLVAILSCLQARHRRPAPTREARDGLAVHRSLNEPSAERESTPCIVLREHHDRSGLSVARVLLEKVSLHNQTLASWMRAVVPPSSEPDRDIVHLAMAPTLPGVPILVHSIGAQGEASTHVFSEGTWSRSASNAFLLRAIRYAQLVATAIPLTSSLARSGPGRPAQQAAALQADDGRQPCDLVALGLRYDHIAVHAAISELREYRRNLRRV